MVLVLLSTSVLLRPETMVHTSKVCILLIAWLDSDLRLHSTGLEMHCCYTCSVVHAVGHAGKLKNRNNLLMKLAGSTWGASANTALLRSSALALCYSAAEYCAPVWSRSAHTSQVDVQLNSTMRLIPGTLRSTPLPWLPVLSNIEPPALRRKAATDKLVEKIVKHDSCPIQPDILNPPLLRLTSRKPLWLDLQSVDVKSRWRHNWKSAQVVNSRLVCDPTIQQLGFDLPRQQWSLPNRFRTKQGHCGACRRKWRLTDADLCPCGKTQTMSHIVESCPLTKLNGGLSRLHSADEDAVSWLTSYGSWHAYEKKKKWCMVILWYQHSCRSADQISDAIDIWRCASYSRDSVNWHVIVCSCALPLFLTVILLENDQVYCACLMCQC